jgi:hypothetical protein
MRKAIRTRSKDQGPATSASPAARRVGRGHRHYRKAIELDEIREGSLGLGIALRDQKKLDGAIAAYRRPLKSTRKTPWVTEISAPPVRRPERL